MAGTALFVLAAGLLTGCDRAERQAEPGAAPPGTVPVPGAAEPGSDADPFPGSASPEAAYPGTVGPGGVPVDTIDPGAGR